MAISSSVASLKIVNAGMSCARARCRRHDLSASSTSASACAPCAWAASVALARARLAFRSCCWFMRRVHMDADEAVRAYDALVARGNGHPTAMVPMHWGTFKLTDEPMDEPPVRARAAWREAGFSEGSLWMLKHGETRATANGGESRNERQR